MWSDGSLDLRKEARTRAPVIEDPEGIRGSVVGTWRGRMINEWMSSYVFSALADQLEDAGEPEAARECRAFAAEEREHGRLCAGVVVAAGGEAVAPAAPPRALPRHPRASRRAAALRNAISVACLSETVAVALIGAERLEMPESPLRALLSRIWADEYGHARFGWSLLARMLPALTADERLSVEAYLPYALGHLEAHELAHLPIACEPPGHGRVFGLCSGRAARELFYATVTDVILPSLEARGLRAQTAWQGRKAA